MEITSYQCPSCGAPLSFSGEDNKLHCSGCGNAYERENIEQFGDAEAKSKEESSFRWSACSGEETLDTVVYTCPQCGGEITGDQVTAAARCPYCDNNVVMSSQVSGILKPDLIIPFKTTKEQAIEALKNFYKKKKLLPDAFKSENRIKEIKGIYVPFWLFDCGASASFVFDCTQVSSWRSGDYEYTKTDHYAAVRSGNADFDGIPVDASSKMADDFMDSLEPFDLKDAISFDEAVLSGFLADKFDVSSEKSLPRANSRVKNSVSDLFRDTVKGYATVRERSGSVQVDNGNIRYALLPVWILNTRYKDKVYTFAMNGQTGKLIGELPVDRGKYWRRFLITTAAIAAPIIALLLMWGGGLF